MKKLKKASIVDLRKAVDIKDIRRHDDDEEVAICPSCGGYIPLKETGYKAYECANCGLKVMKLSSDS